MKTIFNKTTYSILIVVVFCSLMAYAHATGIPLNQAPWTAPWNSVLQRGQQKTGPLTVGTATQGTSALTVAGTGLRVEGVNCSSSPFSLAATANGSRPCPYSPFTPNTSTGTELRVLGSGGGIGGYSHNLVVGSNATITSGTSLDVVGTITADPAPNYLNYATGALYQNSTVDKQLCARPNGDIVVCGTSTDGVCGPLNGTTVTPPVSTATPGMCASGTAVMNQSQLYGTIGWSCVGTGGGNNPSCSATNANQNGTWNGGGPINGAGGNPPPVGNSNTSQQGG